MRERALDLYAILERVEDVPILQPALLQVGASSELMLDDLDKTWGGTSVHIHTRIQILDGARVGAGSNGERRGEHAHLARARGVDGGACARGGTSVHIHTRIQILDGARVGAGSNGERRGEHAHLARARGVDGGACARRDHADHRHGQHLLSDAQACRGGGVARDDHDLDLVLGEPPARL